MPDDNSKPAKDPRPEPSSGGGKLPPPREDRPAFSDWQKKSGTPSSENTRSS